MEHKCYFLLNEFNIKFSIIILVTIIEREYQNGIHYKFDMG